jgi:hypothetical protein
MTELPLSALSSRVTFIDPAASKTKLKRVAANQAIVTVGAYDRWIFVLEAWRGRLPTEQFHDKIIENARVFQPSKLCCEANAMQILFAEDIKLVARLKGIRLPVTPIYQNTRIEKPTRIRLGLQPVVNFGRLFIDKQRFPELVEELLAHPHGRTVDLVDALNSAIAELPARAPEKVAMDVEETLKSYLEKLGKNERFVEQRIASWRAERGRQRLSNMLEPFPN